jgi:hypothetical protein
MERNKMNDMLPTNPIPQIAALPYSLYLSIQGKYFSGYTGEVLFGNGNNAWAGLFNPIDSRVNLHIYYWEVINTGPSPVRARIYFNSIPPGQRKRVDTVFQGNTTLCPPPMPRTRLYQASNVAGEPEGGVRAFVIFLSNPETPYEPASATLGFEKALQPLSCMAFFVIGAVGFELSALSANTDRKSIPACRF